MIHNISIWFTLIRFFYMYSLTFMNYFQIPKWACFLAAFGVFSYHTLDVLDGKQAVRIGRTSPLGELLDHGCDAMSIGKIKKEIPPSVEIMNFKKCPKIEVGFRSSILAWMYQSTLLHGLLYAKLPELVQILGEKKIFWWDKIYSSFLFIYVLYLDIRSYCYLSKLENYF